MVDKLDNIVVTGTQQVDVTISRQQIANIVADGHLPFTDLFWAMQSQLPERFGISSGSFIDGDGNWVADSIYGYNTVRKATPDEIDIYNDFEHIRQTFFKLKLLGKDAID